MGTPVGSFELSVFRTSCGVFGLVFHPGKVECVCNYEPVTSLELTVLLEILWWFRPIASNEEKVR
jgi:hypothetical protein